MADYLTLADILAEIKKAVKAVKGSKDTLIKMMINMVYLNEILLIDDLYPLYWLVKFDDSLVSKAPAIITDITAATPPVVTAEAHGRVAGDVVSHHNVVGMIEVNDRFFLVGTVAANTYELQDLDGTNIVGADYTAYTSGGISHHRGVTPSLSIQSILNVQWLDEKPMVVITREELMERNAFWNDSTARPTRYMHTKHFNNAGAEVNKMLWFLGADAAYKLQYWYLLRPTKLTANADVPLLPPQFHHAIIAGVITRLIENNVQVENQIIWPGIYTEQLEGLKIFNRKYYKDNDVTSRQTPFLI